jgi:hypothetical protein
MLGHVGILDSEVLPALTSVIEDRPLYRAHSCRTSRSIRKRLTRVVDSLGGVTKSERSLEIQAVAPPSTSTVCQRRRNRKLPDETCCSRPPNWRAQFRWQLQSEQASMLQHAAGACLGNATTRVSI